MEVIELRNKINTIENITKTMKNQSDAIIKMNTESLISEITSLLNLETGTLTYQRKTIRIKTILKNIQEAKDCYEAANSALESLIDLTARYLKKEINAPFDKTPSNKDSSDLEEIVKHLTTEESYNITMRHYFKSVLYYLSITHNFSLSNDISKNISFLESLLNTNQITIDDFNQYKYALEFLFTDNELKERYLTPQLTLK